MCSDLETKHKTLSLNGHILNCENAEISVSVRYAATHVTHPHTFIRSGLQACQRIAFTHNKMLIMSGGEVSLT